MPISKINEELAKLSKLKTEFNREREQYDDLQQDFKEYIEVHIGKGQELLDFQERAGYTHIMNEMNQDHLWRRYNELLQKKDSGGLSLSDKKEFHKLEERVSVKRLKNIKDQADFEQRFMDVQNIDELRKYMDGDIEWRRYKELSGAKNKSKNDIKELDLLSKQPDVERMLVAEEGRKNKVAKGVKEYTPPYVPDSTSEGIDISDETKREIMKKKYDIELKVKYKTRVMDKYLEQREKVKSKILNEYIGNNRAISPARRSATNDLINFVEAIDSDLMTTDGTNGFSFDRAMSEALRSSQLFFETQLESIAKAYSFRVCTGDYSPIKRREFKDLQFIKINPINTKTLSTPEDFNHVRLAALANKRLLEMSPAMVDLDTKEDEVIATISAKEEVRLRELGKSEEEIEAQIKKIKKSTIFPRGRDANAQVVEKKEEIARKQAELRELGKSKEGLMAETEKIEKFPIASLGEKELSELKKVIDEKKAKLLELDKSEREMKVEIEEIEGSRIFPKRKESITEQIEAIKQMDISLKYEPDRFLTTEDDMSADEWYVDVRKDDLKIEEMDFRI
ncbi:MAG: hypothetical protein PSN36_01925 [Gammaproteobacteria bacterium]|nr:hypothetical protein [Gammaproteobacteria bacterium]